MTTDVRHTPSFPQAMDSPIPVRTPYLLTWLLAVVVLAATIPTVALEGVLRGEPVMNGSARGTALVMAVVAVPLLLASAELVRRGSLRCVPLWLGAVAFLAYNTVMLSFGTPFNALFLLYVAMFPLCFWTVVAVLSALDVPEFAASITPGTWRRTMAAILGTIAVLNALAWLRAIVPDLGSDDPATLRGTGLITVPTYVQDLGFWLPLMIVVAVWMWTGRTYGHLLTVVLLTQLTVEAISVAADQWLGSSADPDSTIASMSAVPAFLVVGVICLLPLLHLLSHIPRATTGVHRGA